MGEWGWIAVAFVGVSAAKEVVRILGDLRSDEALSFLLEWSARPDLHEHVLQEAQRELLVHEVVLDQQDAPGKGLGLATRQ